MQATFNYLSGRINPTHTNILHPDANYHIQPAGTYQTATTYQWAGNFLFFFYLIVRHFMIHLIPPTEISSHSDILTQSRKVSRLLQDKSGHLHEQLHGQYC